MSEPKKRGRPPLGPEALTTIVSAGCKETEAEAIREAAKRAGMSTSAWARRALLRGLEGE